MSAAVVCVGHVALDAISLVQRRPEADGRVVASRATIASGGPAATAAVTLARLGIEAAFIGTVGDDDAGRLALLELEREGVDASRVRIVEGPTAISTITVDGSGRRSIAAFNGVSTVPELSAVDLAALGAAAWIHVDHVGARAIPELRRSGVTTPISVDAGNPIDGLDLAAIDLWAPTERRLFEQTGAGDRRRALAVGLEAGCSIVAVTAAAEGSYAAWRAGSGEVVFADAPAFPVDVVSTLGAGDVWHGALLAALVRGHELAPALRIANAVAALSCRALDGRSAIPTWEEAMQLVGDEPDQGTVDRIAVAGTRP